MSRSPSTYDLSAILSSSAIKQNEEDRLVRWYSRLGFESRVRLMDQAYQRFRNVPNRHKDWKGKFAELQYSMFLVELMSYRRQAENSHRKAKVSHSKPLGSVLDPIILGSIKRPRRASNKRNLVSVRAYSAIKELRGQKKGWRFIAEYISKMHKHRISHTYLARVWGELNHSS